MKAGTVFQVVERRSTPDMTYYENEIFLLEKYLDNRGNKLQVKLLESLDTTSIGNVYYISLEEIEDIINIINLNIKRKTHLQPWL